MRHMPGFGQEWRNLEMKALVAPRPFRSDLRENPDATQRLHSACVTQPATFGYLWPRNES